MKMGKKPWDPWEWYILYIFVNVGIPYMDPMCKYVDAFEKSCEKPLDDSEYPGFHGVFMKSYHCTHSICSGFEAVTMKHY